MQHSKPSPLLRVATIIVLTMLSLRPASALTIDTSGAWVGLVNNGWFGSGQSLTVDNNANVFDSFSFYVHSDSNGRIFDFSVSDALNGGVTLFSTSNLVATGINTIDINQAFTPGGTIFVLLDYRGFSGQTVHYVYDTYLGGNSSFLSGGTQEAYVNEDHRFIAQFSGGAATVPDTAPTLGLLALGLAGAFLASRKRSVTASVEC